jgi:hypothetical protein
MLVPLLFIIVLLLELTNLSALLDLFDMQILSVILLKFPPNRYIPEPLLTFTKLLNEVE